MWISCPEPEQRSEAVEKLGAYILVGNLIQQED